MVLYREHIRGCFVGEGQSQANDHLFFSVFKASHIGIALEDLEGRPLFANPALCSMLGFSEEEMRKKHCAEFSPLEDAQKDWALFEQLRAGSIDHYQLEKRFFRRDGSVIWGRLNISLLENGASPLVVAMVEDLSEKRAAQTEPLRSGAGVENLGGRLIQAQEEELARIARALHDYIDSLSLVGIDLDRFVQNPPESVGGACREIEKIRQQVKDIVNDIDALRHRVHSSELEYLGLTVATASLCNELSKRLKVNIDFQFEGVPHELPREISLCLYRVLQEALLNAIKHSASLELRVSLSFPSDGTHLIVRDSGIGFDPHEAMKGSGLGLISMRERLKLVDGILSIESQTKHGATIHAQVPLKA